MDKKSVIGAVGAALASGAIFIGTIATGVSAQTTPTTQSTTPTTVPEAQVTPNPAQGPKSGLPFPGGGHKGLGGKGGFGPGGFGEFGELKLGGVALTADMVNRHITATTELLTLARTDLAYANGKMDTANVTKWLNNADALIKEAQAAVAATEYESASLTAGAARELIMTAESQMGYTLGYDQLPSASQRQLGRMGRMGRMGHMGHKLGIDPNATITQAQASRVLAQTYNNLTAQTSLITVGNATAYLTDAQNAYKAAYDAYNAGKYTDAVFNARLAQQLAGVGRHLQAAADAPASPDSPVQVPGPTF